MCVDFIVFPFSNVNFIGDLGGCLLNTGAPSTRNCPVAPESEKSQCTARFGFGVLEIFAAIGSSRKLLACTIDCPAISCVRVGSGSGLQKSATLVISGDNLPAYVELSSSIFIVTSSEPQVVFDTHTVLSSEQSGKILHSIPSSFSSSSAPKQAK